MRAYTPFCTIYDCKENATNIQGQIWKNVKFIINLSNIFTNYGSHILHYISRIYSRFVYILKKRYMSYLIYHALLCGNPPKIYYLSVPFRLFILLFAVRENCSSPSSILKTMIYRKYAKKLSIESLWFKLKRDC